MSSDMKPLPAWRQWWRRTAAKRQERLSGLRIAGAKLFTLAISAVGATLVAFGVYEIFAPAGYMVGGLLIWVLQWSNEQDKGRKE